MAAAPRSWTWACGCCVGRRRKGGAGAGAGESGAGASGRAEEGDEWSLFMDLSVLEAATDGFSDGNLLGRGGFGPTWKLFEEGRSLEIVDPNLSDPDTEQTLLCIQLGLLCCQAVVSDRPDMHSVHLILSSGSFTLPKPGKPAIHGRTGRWMTTTASGSASASSSATGASSTNTTSTFGTDTNTTRASVLANIAEDESRNSISISFTTEGR
ncbi:hypothetical protein C2845_PM07G02890 [Panicum miliaceum]|uniref:Uncharacterized protein n=1 Tax=Panicum miliaceum TaxID=4540 RepID=A0A3L6SRP7_PANMI|nr:hypothetical protein C2845_PM07G02890 [Panicum miliaceum]